MKISEKTTDNRNLQDTLLTTLHDYQESGIMNQLNYDKFMLLSLVANSAAMEGSTLSEIECQLLIDEGIPAKEKKESEQQMVLDLKAAYDQVVPYISQHGEISVALLKEWAGKILQHTGKIFDTPNGQFNSAKGEFRKLDVMAGVGGASYPNHLIVEPALEDFCKFANRQRQTMIYSQDAFEQYRFSFDCCYLLESIHPWIEGNGRMARLVMNAIQYEFNLTPNKVLKSNKADYIENWLEARGEDTPATFRTFLMNEHIFNLQSEKDKYLYDNNLSCGSSLNEPQPATNEPQENMDEPQRFHRGEPQSFQSEPQIGNNEPQDIFNYEPQEDSLAATILQAIDENNKITREELAQITGTSVSTIKRRLKKMSDQIQFVGSGYSGYWEIKKQ